MNWQVAEAALFHGGGSSGYCEDEMEKEKANHKIVVDTIREELMRVQNELKLAREELSDGRDCVDFKSQHM